ncbi:MAG TPA: transcriptional regulator [Nannocystis exedens]|nr:transcriptional regulator [Nannocystis exedens]
MSRGLVLGKFMPPHAGHLFLVDFARRMVDELTVVVGTLGSEPIAGELRYRWMCELVPGSEVLHLTDENPQDPSEHPDFWGIWRRSLLRILPRRPDVVFASEPYGQRLAAELGASFVPVDLERQALPISGTAVRRDPWAYWQYLPACVRAHYVRRVSIFGPESTGKSTLAAQLARRYGTVAVPEYARTWLKSQKHGCKLEHMELIARGQGAAEDALARVADHLLFCDTDPLATAIWSEALFAEVPAALMRMRVNDVRDYALAFLLDVDVPYIDDPVRYLPEKRQEFFERCAAELRRAGRSFVVLRGDWSARWSRACAAIDALLVADGCVPPAPAPPVSGIEGI